MCQLCGQKTHGYKPISMFIFIEYVCKDSVLQCPMVGEEVADI